MARASGRVILRGEPAGVYGVPAIAAGIGAGAAAVAEPVPHGAPASIMLGDRAAMATDGSDLGRALAALLEALAAPPLALRVELEVPPGCGLGASAAAAVAAARAVIARLAVNPPEPEPPATTARVLAAAAAWERVFHGNPSGIDAAAAAHGGVLLFRRATGHEALRLRAPLPLSVAIAGPPASTRAMVEAVAELRRRRPDLVDGALRGIEGLVDDARRHLLAHDLPALGGALDENHAHLRALGVSTPEIDRAVTLARSAGALGAKLTGSGGGGAVIALATEPEPVLAAWRASGFGCFATSIAAPAPPAPGAPGARPAPEPGADAPPPLSDRGRR